MSSSRLGKGFEALFSADPAPSTNPGEPMMVPLSRIEPNPDQPRREFDPEAMKELAESIREKGIIQPIIVERKESGGFVIVAGERRYRAAKMIGLDEVPVFIKAFGDDERLEIALIENIQRTDLTPLEEAEAYRKLMELRGYTQEQLAKRVGKQRTTIANALRLLKLPEEIKKKINDGMITAGHARAILSLDSINEQIMLADEVVRNKLSVRDAEKKAEAQRGDKGSKKTSSADDGRPDPEIALIENDLMEKYGTRVRIHVQKEGGKIELFFFGTDDFNRLIQLLTGKS